ncbi:hypothetical protein OQA88_13414 [Cercophora sp. LCS_1]
MPRNLVAQMSDHSAGLPPNTPGDDTIQIPRSGGLGDLLREKAIGSVGGVEFWPLELLRHIISEDRLRQELTRLERQQTFPHSVDEMAAIIRPRTVDFSPESSQDSYLRVFALLVLLGKGNEIGRFVTKKATDAILPVDYNKDEKKLYKDGKEVQALTLGKWRPHEMEYFRDYQWAVTPAFFDFSHVDDTYLFCQRTLLPWVPDGANGSNPASGTSERMGGFGLVEAIKIDPRSRRFDGVLKSVGLSGCELFALKTLEIPPKGSPEAVFENEFKQLRRFNGEVHPHIVTLLASYHQKNKYHFIFPWARLTLEDILEDGDDKLKEFPLPLTGDRVTRIRWMAKQLEGITGAIKNIHEPDHLYKSGGNPKVADGERRWGRHSDLKPDNILWFNSNTDPLGNLVVTDLGLATFNRLVSRSNQPGVSARVPGYRAPECDIKDAYATRGTDIWNLGCIYLEMIAWLLGGPDLCEEFKDLRKSKDHLSLARSPLFFEFEEGPIGRKQGLIRVKVVVSEFFARLHRMENCPDFAHDVLDIIEDEMLIVNPPKPGVPNGQSARTSSELLFEKFKGLHEKCHISEDYAATGKAEDRQVREQPWYKVELNPDARADDTG